MLGDFSTKAVPTSQMFIIPSVCALSCMLTTSFYLGGRFCSFACSLEQLVVIVGFLKRIPSLHLQLGQTFLVGFLLFPCAIFSLTSRDYSISSWLLFSCISSTWIQVFESYALSLRLGPDPGTVRSDCRAPMNPIAAPYISTKASQVVSCVSAPCLLTDTQGSQILPSTLFSCMSCMWTGVFEGCASSSSPVAGTLGFMLISPADTAVMRTVSHYVLL